MVPIGVSILWGVLQKKVSFPFSERTSRATYLESEYDACRQRNIQFCLGWQLLMDRLKSKHDLLEVVSIAICFFKFPISKDVLKRMQLVSLLGYAKFETQRTLSGLDGS